MRVCNERQRASYPQPWMIHQEYPRDPDEAFVQTGRPRFDKTYLDKHRELCREPLPAAQWPELLRGLGDGLQVFELPQPGHRYCAGADVAEGLEHGDYSDLSVLDADADGRPTEVLSLHGHWEPDQFAELIYRVARLYPGLYGIERNNHGLATLIACRKLGMRGLYAERPVLNKLGQEVEPAWAAHHELDEAPADRRPGAGAADLRGKALGCGGDLGAGALPDREGWSDGCAERRL